jgi:hypothetical protein
MYDNVEQQQPPRWHARIYHHAKQHQQSWGPHAPMYNSVEVQKSYFLNGEREEYAKTFYPTWPIGYICG